MNKDIEKAIDGLKRIKIGFFNAYIDRQPIVTFLDTAITALEAEKESLWIPVYKKLPDSDCMCKVIIFDDWTKKIFETEVKFEIRFKVAEGNYVVAWKPLDEPYDK